MSFEYENPLQRDTTHALDGPALSSGGGVASMPPPPFQLQVGPGGGGEEEGTPSGGMCMREGEGEPVCYADDGPVSPEREGECAPDNIAVDMPDDLLMQIYMAAGSAGEARALVRSLSEGEVDGNYIASQETVDAENQDHVENPMNTLDPPRRGQSSSSRQWQNIEWDLPDYIDNSEDGMGGGHLTPAQTGQEEDPETLRQAFEQHRLMELRALVGTEVTLAQMLTAERIAQAHGSPLHEGVRRTIFTANQYAMAMTLNPEQSFRYRPGRLRENSSNHQTYCNTYVYDLLRGFGVVEAALPGGRANSQNRTLRRERYRDYWTAIEGDAEAAQQRANEGHLVIATAHGGTRARRDTDEGEGPFFHAGHFSMIMAENEARDAHAGRSDEGTFSPLESNAGGGNSFVGEGAGQRPSANWRFENRADLYREHPEVYGTRNRRGQQTTRAVDWWNNNHTDGVFYEYTGSVSNPEALGGTETMGLSGN